MIALDTNILVYGERIESAHHAQARRLLRDLAEGDEPRAIPWPCVYEFLKVVTHPRVSLLSKLGFRPVGTGWQFGQHLGLAGDSILDGRVETGAFAEFR